MQQGLPNGQSGNMGELASAPFSNDAPQFPAGLTTDMPPPPLPAQQGQQSQQMLQPMQSTNAPYQMPMQQPLQSSLQPPLQPVQPVLVNGTVPLQNGSVSMPTLPPSNYNATYNQQPAMQFQQPVQQWSTWAPGPS